MRQPTGRSIPLSLPRRFVGDLVHFARGVPTVPVERRMQLAAVVAARQAARPRPSWCALFTKAYAMTAALHAPLRRAYLKLPTPHLYEHPISVASVAIERRLNEEDAVFFAPFRRPDEKPLAEIDLELRRLKDVPIEQVAAFRRTLRLSAWPRPLRRLVWWLGLNAWGRKRAHYMGTFGVSAYASLGAASLHPLSPLTTALNYGVINDQSNVDVRIIYDHRVMDGATVARALADLERILRCEIVAELKSLQVNAAA
ncbi:MAG TPA: hypothetical protein VFA18_24685 [Gemmataceae bacterium]|nr:hypothetical protein [Gemmataceae bacterium]